MKNITYILSLMFICSAVFGGDYLPDTLEKDQAFSIHVPYDRLTVTDGTGEATGEIEIELILNGVALERIEFASFSFVTLSGGTSESRVASYDHAGIDTAGDLYCLVEATYPTVEFTFRDFDHVFVRDFKVRLDSAMQVVSASQPMDSTAFVVSGNIMYATDAGWGSRLYQRDVEVGEVSHIVRYLPIPDFDTGEMEWMYQALIYGYITSIDGRVIDRKVGTPFFETYSELDTHLDNNAKPSGWGGTFYYQTSGM